MIDNLTGKDRKCPRCGADEFRIDGYCSIYCRDMDDAQDEIKEPIRTIITDLKTKSNCGMDDYMKAIKKIEEIVK